METKFRIWDGFNNRMIYPDEINKIGILLNGDLIDIEESKDEFSNPFYGEILNPNTYILMQFIGKQDIYDIYENDIIKCNFGIGLIYWDKDQLGFFVNIFEDNESMPLCDVLNIGVVGNKYQNPELIKE